MQHLSNVTNPFVHGFDNGVHLTRESTDGQHYVCVTYSLLSCWVRPYPGGPRIATARFHVLVRLFGSSWTEKDIERAERNSRYLSADATDAQTRSVATSLLRTCHTWLSVELKTLS